MSVCGVTKYKYKYFLFSYVSVSVENICYSKFSFSFRVVNNNNFHHHRRYYFKLIKLRHICGAEFFIFLLNAQILYLLFLLRVRKNIYPISVHC